MLPKCYYFVINDNLDVATLGDYYTNGSYGFRVESNYNKRYRYRGNFSFRYENLINGERGLPVVGQQPFGGSRASSNWLSALFHTKWQWQKR